jgi:RNA polymerase sigma-70 factor, ECF subfamily
MPTLAVENVSHARSKATTKSLPVPLPATGEDFSGKSDEAVMQAIADRQSAALTELHKRYNKTLRAVIAHVVHEEAEAEDVLQEIFVQIWREAVNYSPDAGKPLGWIVTVARRRAIDRLRRRQAYGRAKDRFEIHVEQQPHTRMASPVENDITRIDLRRFLEGQMEELPPYQREAIELSFFEGLSHREIAARTATPLGTVKTRLELGLRKLTNSVRPLRYKV